MNLRSQQLRSDLSLEVDFDQTLTSNEIKTKLREVLGDQNCFEETILNHKVFIYRNDKGVKQVLLYANVSYLGGVHPIFKKRMQLPKRFKEIALELSGRRDYFVRFLGVYHYKGNVIFVDFVKDTYISKKMNNSSAHVYINDLYQGTRLGTFKKYDRNDNLLYVIRGSKLRGYLNDSYVIYENKINKLFDMFTKFNYGFPFGKWLEAIQCVEEMRQKSFSQWAQAEWAGWYLEFSFSNFTISNETESYCKCVGRKDNFDLDFDLYFSELTFYGDLKSESLSSSHILGNDKESVLEAVNLHDRFWYIVYEHDTIKDKDMNYEATLYINQLKYDNSKWPKNKDFDPYSYKDRMKHSVNYKKMYIIEVNRINFSDILSDFNQGKQPSGEARNTKVMISKKILDNFIIYKYNYEDQTNKQENTKQQ